MSRTLALSFLLSFLVTAPLAAQSHAAGNERVDEDTANVEVVVEDADGNRTPVQEVAEAQEASDDAPAIRPLRTRGLPMELAALLLSGQQGGPVPFEILPLVTPTGDGESRVVVVFDMAPIGFQLPTQLPSEQPEAAVSCGGTRKVEIMLYATAEGGAVRDSLLQTFEIDTHRVSPCLLDAGARFVGQLDLPPGDVSLRALVRIAGEHVGLRVVPLSVGPSGQVVGADGTVRSAWLSPPLVFGLSDDRPTLYEVTGGGAPVIQPPPGLGGVPAADPVVRRDETVEVKVLAAGLDRIGSEWRAVIQDDGGKILGQVPAKLDYGPSDGEVRVLNLQFDTVGFPVGQMLLSLQSGAGSGGTDAAAEPERSPESLDLPSWREERFISTTHRIDLDKMPEHLRDGQAGGLVATPTVRLTVVADRASAFSTDLTAGLPDDYDPTAAQARRAATDVARQSLPAIRDAFDTGDWAAARDGITQVASQVGSAYGQEGLNQLGRETLEFFQGARMLPASLLHYDVYREARRLREFLVSTYAREVMVAAMRKLEDDPKTVDGLVASFYALLGVELQSAGLVRFSTAMLQRAVDLDPGQGAARLSVAINYEQLGLMEDAAQAYQELLDLQPDNEVAALRHAIALRHLQRGRAARDALEALVDSARESWVLAVAYQELAMVRLDADGPPAARDLLRQALQRLPREPRLYVQLAFVLDTLGQHAAAIATLDDMRLRTETGGGYTPRHRLTQWSSDATAGLESRLRALADQQLRSLQSSGSAEGGAP